MKGIEQCESAVHRTLDSRERFRTVPLLSTSFDPFAIRQLGVDRVDDRSRRETSLPRDPVAVVILRTRLPRSVPAPDPLDRDGAERGLDRVALPREDLARGGPPAVPDRRRLAKQRFADGERSLWTVREFREVTGLEEGFGLRTTQAITIVVAIIIVIVLSNFRETRPVAILLSSKGEVR